MSGLQIEHRLIAFTIILRLAKVFHSSSLHSISHYEVPPLPVFHCHVYSEIHTKIMATYPNETQFPHLLNGFNSVSAFACCFTGAEDYYLSPFSHAYFQSLQKKLIFSHLFLLCYTIKTLSTWWSHSEFLLFFSFSRQATASWSPPPVLSHYFFSFYGQKYLPKLSVLVFCIYSFFNSFCWVFCKAEKLVPFSPSPGKLGAK